MVAEYSAHSRSELLPIFENHPYLHALSEAFLKEGLGDAFVDDETHPAVVLLGHKGVYFLSGEANHSSVSELLELVEQKSLIFVPSGRWEDRIKNHWGDQLKPYPRTKFSSAKLDVRHMKEIQSRLPEEMTVEKVTSETIHRLSNGAKRIITLLFPSIEKFMESNFGFIIREGETIVSVALAASPLYTNEFEIHIETHPDYQKQGLAMISAAALIQYSLENGMVPHWDADNPPSVKLAIKLGFSEPEEYNAYYWVSEDVVQP